MRRVAGFPGLRGADGSAAAAAYDRGGGLRSARSAVPQFTAFDFSVRARGTGLDVRELFAESQTVPEPAAAGSNRDDLHATLRCRSRRS